MRAYQGDLAPIGATGLGRMLPPQCRTGGGMPREGPADDSRPPRTRRTGLRGTRRGGRRARPARGAVAGRSPVPGWASWPGPRPAGSTNSASALGERVAVVSQNSARLLTAFLGVSAYGRVLVPVNFRLSAHEVGYIVEHSGASVLLVDPELDDALADVAARHRFVIGDESDAVLYRFGEAPQPWERGRGRDRHHQLHERHDRASEGCAAHAPQPLDQLGHVRLARRRQRPRRLPAHVADVPLQRLGHDVRRHRHGWHATSCCARSTVRRSCDASTRTASR